ncbi:sigma-54-dependent Fis family transcriptional regulator [Roseibium sp. CAU 1637]|uniref:Sigma-54-dependent Fis family transcriptional regulator n=1 Tax=Roseibium limicola TaxID=2816037 RepID=A0A939J5N2_9HYPH|nr:sigma-54 dependent transcriptional regulator [Roseibium limicola]MBO0344242.1 sigma-54-dependent Fis family transcriptional regulator [Roseibium limicola]
MQASPSVQTGHDAPDHFEADLAEARVLIVDDEIGMRNFLQKTLQGRCARVDVAADAEESSRLLDLYTYDVVVLDNIMPRQSGVNWLGEQQRIGFFADAILMTAYADLDTAIAAIRAGASDFLLKPFRSNQIINAISQSLKRARLRRQNAILSYELEAGKDLVRHREALLGTSPEIQAVRELIKRAAATPAHAVIRGEVGSGKQIAARMLHSHSPRAERPFIWLQCSGMNDELFQNRLFGRVEATVDGDQSIDGMLLNAMGGTLFLDDVELLSSNCQNMLVEMLTTGKFRPLGAERSLPLDMRIICSNVRPLRQAVEERSFRADLFYLLNVAEIYLPPLRERPEDILTILDFFTESFAARMGSSAPEMSPAVRRKIMAHPWPGNVLELGNYVERALIQRDFASALGGFALTDENETLATVERRHILSVLESCGGNRSEAARRLGVARKTIDRKCQAWGV